MKFKDLAAMRKAEGLSLEAVADKLGVSKVTVMNWEKDPGSIPVDKLVSYSTAINHQFSELFVVDSNKVDVNWTIPANQELEIERIKLRGKIKELEQNNGKLAGNGSGSGKAYTDTSNSMNTILRGLRKPRVAFIGEFDSGKSTLINKMLGMDVLPARYTPTTSIVVRVVHADEKPKWLLGNTVVVVTKDGEDLPEAYNLRDRDYYNSHIFKLNGKEFSGDQTLIESFGTRDSDTDVVEEADLPDDGRLTIFTYIDTELLKSIELWDTPGYGSDDTAKGAAETGQSIFAQTQADIFLFLSKADGFMGTNDLQYLPAVVKRVTDASVKETKWDNLYIVASKANNIDEDDDHQPHHQLENILSKRSIAIANVLTREQANITLVPGEELHATIRRRTFAYDIKDKELGTKLAADLRENITKYQESILKESEGALDATFQRLTGNFEDERKKLTSFRDSQSKAKEALESALKDEPAAREGIRTTTNELKQKAAVLKAMSRSQFSSYLDELLSDGSLVDLMKSWGTKNNKKSKNEFASSITNRMQNQLDSILRRNSEDFERALHNAMQRVQIDAHIDAKFFNFDSIAAGIIAGGLVSGAFAVVAAGITSNLGLYLVAGSVGGALTSAGVISSPTVLVSLVSALGGPVAWVIGLSVLAGGLAAAVTRGATWHKKFAGQLRESIRANEGSINAEIDKYWDKTSSAVDTLKTQMEADLNGKIAQRKREAKADPKDIQATIDELVALNATVEKFQAERKAELNEDSDEQK